MAKSVERITKALEAKDINTLDEFIQEEENTREDFLIFHILSSPEQKEIFEILRKYYFSLVNIREIIQSDELKRSDVAKIFPDPPLYDAVEFGDLAKVKLLLNFKADVNVWNKYNRQTPLACAAVYGNVDTCKLLLSRGADVNIKNKWSQTPLHRVTMWGSNLIAREATIKLLINAGSSLNVYDNNKRLPIPITCFEKYVNNITSIPSNVLLTRDFPHEKDIKKKSHDFDCVVCEGFVGEPALSVLQLSLKAGLKLNEEQWNDLVEDHPCLAETREEYLNNRLRLRYMSRIAIREYLIKTSNGSTIYPKLKSLPVPSLLKSYMMLET